MLVGLLVCAGLLITGAGFWLALAAYSVAGTLTTIAAAVWNGYLNNSRRRMPSARSNETHARNPSDAHLKIVQREIVFQPRSLPTPRVSRRDMPRVKS